MIKEENYEEMYKLFEEIYDPIAKELLIDLDKDSLNAEDYDEDNKDHQNKYYHLLHIYKYPKIPPFFIPTQSS